jgi:hypothetical protein
MFQGDIFKTVLELVYFKEEAVRNQRVVPTAWQEQMAIERRPDAGQGAQEEGNYVHQPQLEPGSGPMGKKERKLCPILSRLASSRANERGS